MATPLGSGITEGTKWPDFPLSESTRLIVHRFYDFVDTETDEACAEFSKLFVPDGKMVIGPKLVQGRAALEKERHAAWVKVGRRKHGILKVYVTDTLGLDVFVFGIVNIATRNGRSFSQEFTANFLLVQWEGQVLISEFRAYIDSAPLAKATAGMDLQVGV